MPSCGILRTAMFRFERERVLHCCLYRGRRVHIPPIPSIGDGERISNQRFLRYDGSTPGPFPLICPTQRILNSCYALIKYRRVQTSLRRIIIRSESCLAERHRACQLQFLYRKSIIGEMRACLLQSQDTGASDRTM